MFYAIKMQWQYCEPLEDYNRMLVSTNRVKAKKWGFRRSTKEKKTTSQEEEASDGAADWGEQGGNSDPHSYLTSRLQKHGIGVLQ